MSDDFFAPIDPPTGENLRKAVRYGKNNIVATLTPQQWFQNKKAIAIEIINISSKGACISSKEKLTKNTNIILNLMLNDNYHCKIKAKVIGRYLTNTYGVCFNESQHDAIDQVIRSGTHFTIS